MEKQVTVLGIKRMDFQNGTDSIKGTQIFYIGESENGDDVKGTIPTKAWMPFEEFDKFADKKFPVVCTALYDVDLVKMKLKVIGFKDIK